MDSQYINTVFNENVLFQHSYSSPLQLLLYFFSSFQVSEETFFPSKRRHHQYSTSSNILLHFTTYLHPFPLSVSKKMSLPFSEVKTSYICNFDFMLSKSSIYVNYRSSQLYNFCLSKGSFCSTIHHFS